MLKIVDLMDEGRIFSTMVKNLKDTVYRYVRL